jgi:hypothetical protein
MPGVADAKEQAWGFTEIEITTARGRYRIGKLPGPYFRLMGAAGAEDNELLEALAGLDPQRSLLVVAGEGETIAGATRLAGWVRCRAPYEPFLKRLWGNIPSHYHEHLLADIA